MESLEGAEPTGSTCFQEKIPLRPKPGPPYYRLRVCDLVIEWDFAIVSIQAFFLGLGLTNDLTG